MAVDPEISATAQRVLSRVLCGVDGSPAGEEAVRQGVRLCARDARLLLVSVATPAAAAHVEAAVALEQRAADALRQAEREAGTDSESHLMVGDPVACLLATAREHGASLIAVGSHGTNRLGGILGGSVATAMLHRAHCSVLIARPPRGAGRFPERIAVGVDGSGPSRIALAVATDLGVRLDVPVVAVAASGAATDIEMPDDTGAVLHVDGREPVAALLEAAGTYDLLVVGARGLRGLRALGSVSERVAHRASASVLVVRSAEAATAGPGD